MAEQTRFDVAIAGEINLDLILYGLPQELPVERETLATGFEMTLGSSSAIVAHNLAMLGRRVGFVTCVGQDVLGQQALARLAASSVDVSRTLQSSSATPTGVSVILPHGKQRRILTYPGTMAEMTCASLDIDYLASARHFHLSSLFLQTGLHAGLVALLAELKARGLTISLDTNDDPSGEWTRSGGGILGRVLPLVDLLLPNEDEVLRMAGTSDLTQALASLGAIVPLIVVKCGARGAVVFQNQSMTASESVSVTAIDTIGAGDSFNAGFLAAWLDGKSAAFAARAGNAAGALSTLRPGGTEAFRETALREQFLAEHWPTA